jgi:uncharacterized FlaG/YvyC family protein
VPIVINEDHLMEAIGPIRNQEISTHKEGVGLEKLSQSKKAAYPKKNTLPPDAVVISRMVQAMNNYLNTTGRSDVKIKAYKVNGEITVCAVSKKQGTIIKTIRPEKLLNLNTAISGMVGLLVSTKV